jgi:hypothetical protein
VLKVKTKYCGHMGKCPQCAEPVKIPKLTEEEMVALLLQPTPEEAAAAKAAQAAKAASAEDVLTEMPRDDDGSVVTGGSTMLKRAPKTCPKCKQQCSAKYTICPHCRTFLPFIDVGEAAEATGHVGSLNCPECGVRSFPGEHVCRNCGVVLVE